jgi:phage gpG-like protein
VTTWTTASGDSPDKALERFQRSVRERQRLGIMALAASLKTEIVRQLSTPGAGRYYAKASRAAGETPKGPKNASERAALARRRRQNRKLNEKRRGYAMALNAGAITFGDITSRRVLTGLHRASKPGDPPAPDTGTLRRSAFIEPTENGARVGVAMPYGAALEFGTTRAGRKRNVTIAPRPFMRPALARVREQFGNVFRSMLRTGRS